MIHPPIRSDVQSCGRYRTCTFNLLLLCLLSLSGCSKDEMKKMATSVRQSTQDFAAQSQEYIQGAPEVIEAPLKPTGSFELRMDKDIEIDAANVEVISIGDGRSNLLQVASYDTSSTPTKFPAVLLHGHTQSSSTSGIVGQTVACDLYVQTSPSSEIVMTAPGSSVQVTFGRIDQKLGTVTARIGSGSLISSNDKRINFGGGDLMAILVGEAK